VMYTSLDSSVFVESISLIREQDVPIRQEKVTYSFKCFTTASRVYS
jgi:hypothetical protein